MHSGHSRDFGAELDALREQLNGVERALRVAVNKVLAPDLATELRRLRSQSGRSGRGLAALIGMSQSKLSRIEAGSTLPTLSEARAWARESGATAEEQQWVERITKAAHLS